MYCYKYLIKAFSEMEIQPQPTYRRKSCIFEDFKKFNISEQRFEQQYCSIYKARLKALKDHLLQKAKIKWGKYFYRNYICYHFRLYFFISNILL